MAEYIDWEALRKILENWRDAHADVDDEQGCGLLEDVICEVGAQTVVDAVEVVRCKDCKYIRFYSSGNIYCVHSEGLSSQGLDAFCSYGERKGGDNAT